MFAFTVEPQPLPVVDAGRDADGHAAFACDPPGAAAAGARLLDDLACRAARRTGTRDHEEALLEPELAGAAAVLARLGRRALGRARAVAHLARFLARDLDRRLGAGERLLERDLEVEAQIGATRRTGTATASSEAEEVAEDIGEVREDIRVEPGALLCTA